MYHLDDCDDELAFDPPHAYARLEGQPCSCASRYYGGDCAHTVDEEAELMLPDPDPEPAPPSGEQLADSCPKLGGLGGSSHVVTAQELAKARPVKGRTRTRCRYCGRSVDLGPVELEAAA